MQNKESVRLILPGEIGPECLGDAWSLVPHHQNSSSLVFWDTFEWCLWFGKHTLYRAGETYSLCDGDQGWPGSVVCSEKAMGQRRFWEDFQTEPMRTNLEGMLGLRALTVVAEGRFSRRCDELRNGDGKIVCRLDWTVVSADRQGSAVLKRYCQVLPLRGYEDETARVVEQLTRCGAESHGDGPLQVLLSHGQKEPARYTLRPSFGLDHKTPARGAVGRILGPILDLAIRNMPGIIDDVDTEFLHDYRICLRKMRSVLSLVKDVYPREETRRMREILGDLARHTNRLRDLDVYLLARNEYRTLLPPLLRPTLDGLFDDFTAERKRELRRVVSTLRGPATRKLLHELSELISPTRNHSSSKNAELPVGPLVFQSIFKRYKKIRRLSRGIRSETPDEAIHQIRIECKKLRYLLEFFTELIPGEEMAETLKLLRRLQNRLGEFNDASVQQKSLLEYWQQKKCDGDSGMGLGGLVSILYQRQQLVRCHIVEALEEFCDNSTAGAFKNTFRLPASASAADTGQEHIP